jgi:hypothetical protein
VPLIKRDPQRPDRRHGPRPVRSLASVRKWDVLHLSLGEASTGCQVRRRPAHRR